MGIGIVENPLHFSILTGTSVLLNRAFSQRSSYMTWMEHVVVALYKYSLLVLLIKEKCWSLESQALKTKQKKNWVS